MTDPTPLSTVHPPSSPLRPPRVHQQEEERSIPPWRFFISLVLQGFLVLLIPVQNAYTVTFGRTVILQTVPVDPYDVLRGYYQVLSYDISMVEQLQKLPGAGSWLTTPRPKPTNIYVILEEVPTSIQPPYPWKPIAISPSYPVNLAFNQVALAGFIQDGQVTYGVEQYYIPADQRDQINKTINDNQQPNPQALVMEVKVDGRGKGVPIRLWIGDRYYQF